jgi:hypothetical protein
MLKATGLLYWFWNRQAELDNTLLAAVAEATSVSPFWNLEDKTYRTIVATAMANGHLISAHTDTSTRPSSNISLQIWLAPDRVQWIRNWRLGMDQKASRHGRLRLAACR